MAEITSIEITRSTCEITLDYRQKIACRKTDPAKLGLNTGDEIETEALRGRLCQIQLNEGYEAALCILDRSAKTRAEICKKLALKGYLPEVAEAVCERLESARLIDDSYIAQKVVTAAVSGGRGRFAVKQKLRARGIADEDAESAMEALTDEEQAESCLKEALRLSKKYAALEKREYKIKLSQALARRGFSWDSIEYAVEKIISDQ